MQSYKIDVGRYKIDLRVLSLLNKILIFAWVFPLNLAPLVLQNAALPLQNPPLAVWGGSPKPAGNTLGRSFSKEK